MAKPKIPEKGKKKKVWKAMEIIKVKLNSDQAVLTCCEQPTRGAVQSTQCDMGWGCPGEDNASAISS